MQYSNKSDTTHRHTDSEVFTIQAINGRKINIIETNYICECSYRGSVKNSLLLLHGMLCGYHVVQFGIAFSKPLSLFTWKASLVETKALKKEARQVALYTLSLPKHPTTQ